MAAALGMYSSLISLTLDDITRSYDIMFGILLCVLFGGCTYFVWLKYLRRNDHERNHHITKTSTLDSYPSRNKDGHLLNNGSPDQRSEQLRHSEVASTAAAAAEPEVGCTPAHPPNTLSKQKHLPKDYTIGWICALTIEYVAAQAFFEEIHAGLESRNQADNNDYVLGRIGQHNVAIAVLPDGEYGISSASGVIKDMAHTFPNIRICLMVGIGGGAPSQEHDIRLGDVVVSVPRDGNGGVFQYDFGKTIQHQEFHTTGFLNQPPTLLRTAVSGLRAQYEIQGHQLQNSIHLSLQNNPRLRQKYQRPDSSSDRLYRSDFIHPLNSKGHCENSCGVDPAVLIPRPIRTDLDDDPAIHYGLVASANSLMKDAMIRDKLSTEKGVLCFEMEAAGLMNHLPCLVIRGICDYSNTHKNKIWQGYAAMIAAAYARDLLSRIAPQHVEAEEKLGVILSEIHQVAQSHRDIAVENQATAKEQLQLQKDLLQTRLIKEEQDCHRLFRLTTSEKDATYEWYKDRVEDRVEGTCSWFLQHPSFQIWREQTSGPLLVTADPGCGKSVLSKYLINDVLPALGTTCYFFFKDQDQNTARQALCALLHQIFSLKPFLIHHAMEYFRRDGAGLIHSTGSLWNILQNVTEDPEIGPVILVLDALDECAESEFEDLVGTITAQFHNGKTTQTRLKYLLTSRPYEQVVSKFRSLLTSFPYIRIPGEDESSAISKEVSRVIVHRVKRLTENKGLSSEIRTLLENRLQETTHRTYLWLHLIFDYLERSVFKKTPKAVGKMIAELPDTVDDAYEQVLNRSTNFKLARKALSIMLVAKRPLSVTEMNIAMSIDEESRSLDSLDLEEEEDFKLNIRSWCGLFISIHHNAIYFLHQTAREFLLSGSHELALSERVWHWSIAVDYAHGVLAQACVRYLSFFNSVDGWPKDHQHAFLTYTTQYWADHFRVAGTTSIDQLIPFVMEIYNPSSKSLHIWLYKYLGAIHRNDLTGLALASYFGHANIARIFLARGAELELRDSSNRTSLSYAAMRGSEDVVKLLLDRGAEIDSKDNLGQTPLIHAASRGHKAIFKLLLNGGAGVESKDSSGRTAIHYAAEKGDEALIGLLLDRGAELNVKDCVSWTPLLYAARNGHKTSVQLLLDRGAVVDSKDDPNQTPLSRAAERIYEAAGLPQYRHEYQPTTNLSLGRSAEVGSKDNPTQTTLSCAAKRCYLDIMRDLLQRGAEADFNPTKGPLLRIATAAGKSSTLTQADIDYYNAILKLIVGRVDRVDWGP